MTHNLLISIEEMPDGKDIVYINIEGNDEIISSNVAHLMQNHPALKAIIDNALIHFTLDKSLGGAEAKVLYEKEDSTEKEKLSN